VPRVPLLECLNTDSLQLAPFAQAWSIRCRRATFCGATIIAFVAGLQPAWPRTGSVRQRLGYFLVAGRHSHTSAKTFHIWLCGEIASSIQPTLWRQSYSCLATPLARVFVETLVARPHSGPCESSVRNRTAEGLMACLCRGYFICELYALFITSHVPPITSCLIWSSYQQMTTTTTNHVKYSIARPSFSLFPISRSQMH